MSNTLHSQGALLLLHCSGIQYLPWGCCLPGTGPQLLQSPRDHSLASTFLCSLLSIMGLLTAKVSWRLQVPCLRCCTTVEVGVELNPGCFSRITAISRLSVCLPFALRVHENCRVKSLVYSRRKRAAKYCSVEPCSRTASQCLCRSLPVNSGVASALSWWTGWPGVFHNNREAQEPWCILSFFFSPYQLGAAFVLLCSSEVPVKSHPWCAGCQLSL